jgi:hypothetical protein
MIRVCIYLRSDLNMDRMCECTLPLAVTLPSSSSLKTATYA